MVQVAAHLSVAELQAGYRGSKDATLARHFQVIWLLAQGHDGRRDGAADRLRAALGRGAGGALQPLRAELARRPAAGKRREAADPDAGDPGDAARAGEDPPDDGGVWTAKKVAAVIAAALGLAHVAEQRGWEALRAIGWTIQRPRPRDVRAATPDEQAAFKKTSPRPSPRRRSVIPAR